VSAESLRSCFAGTADASDHSFGFTRDATGAASFIVVKGDSFAASYDLTVNVKVGSRNYQFQGAPFLGSAVVVEADPRSESVGRLMESLNTEAEMLVSVGASAPVKFSLDGASPALMPCVGVWKRWSESKLGS
jgi:hypothetical protein